MKQLILLMIAFFAYETIKAQDTTTDYIYSSEGFEVKTSVFKERVSGHEFKSKGLYTKDGKVLVAAIQADGYYNFNTFYVLDGCETIASNAFQSCYNTYIYIPSSVKSIAPDAFISRAQYYGGSNSTSVSKERNSLAGIQDGAMEEGNAGTVNTLAPYQDPNAMEVARYNVQGVRLSEPTRGVNIVQKSDGTAEKELVK